MSEEELRREIVSVLKDVAWMWEPKERDYLPESCQGDVDNLMKLIQAYTATVAAEAERKARVDELTPLTGNLFDLGTIRYVSSRLAALNNTPGKEDQNG